MPEKIKLIALDTNKEHVKDKEHALEILRRDALQAKGNPKKRIWKRVSDEAEVKIDKKSRGESKQGKDNPAHREAEKPGNSGEG